MLNFPGTFHAVPLVIGDNGFLPDVVAIWQSEHEILRQRIRAFAPEMVAVVAEVSGEVDLPQRQK